MAKKTLPTESLWSSIKSNAKTSQSSWEVNKEERLPISERRNISEIKICRKTTYKYVRITYKDNSYITMNLDLNCQDLVEVGDRINLSSAKILLLVNKSTGETKTCLSGEAE